MIKKKRFWIGIIITVICLYFVFRGIEAEKIIKIASGINIWVLLAVVTVYISGYYIRAIRWHFLLKHIKDIRTRRLFPFLVIGFMFNNILPARAGEFIMSYLVGKKNNIAKSSAFATIIIARVFDGIVMIFYFLTGYTAFYFIKTQAADAIRFNLFGRVFGIKSAVTLFAAAGSAVFITIFLISFFLVHKKEKTIAFLHKIISFFPGKAGEIFNRLIGNFIEGFGILRKKKDFFTVLLFSFTAWTLEAGTYYFMARAMGIEINFLVVAFIMAVANFAIMAPSTSGGIGPFEFFGVGVMLLFAYPKEEATAYVLLIHMMILLPIIILGFIFLFTEGLDFKKIIKAKEEGKDG